MEKKSHISFFAALLVLVLSFSTVHAVVYVDADAAAGGDGASWATAYKYLRDALGSNREIWVAEGTYYPDQSNANPGGTGSRNDTFTLYTGCKIYGGFDGTETSLDQRNWYTNRTVLSGDLNENDTPNFVNHGENSYHVVSGSSAGNLLDGLTITGGAATQITGDNANGGGVFGSPTVQNCLFTLNLARFGGGYYGEGPLINCIFRNNYAHITGYESDGGGIYYYGNEITGCVFLDNDATWGGGAFCYGDGVSIRSCTFTGNYASQAGDSGDALYLSTWNSGGGNTSSLYNCIFWDNGFTAPSIYLKSYSGGAIDLTIDYCDIEGGLTEIDTSGLNITINWTVNNKDSDPLFVNGYRLSAGSPCLDAGDNSKVPSDATDVDSDGDTSETLPLDADGKSRFIEDPAANTGNGTPPLVDMGASERARIVFVDTDATGDNNGAGWMDAFTALQDGISAAASGNQIWVAEGTYKPDQGSGYTPGNRSHSFVLKNNVEIYGGFKGNETLLSQRNWSVHETRLSGEIGTPLSEDNSYHVVVGSGTASTAVLDGFTVLFGYADGTSDNSRGGGIFSYGGSPTVRNCTFQYNYALYGGGAFQYVHGQAAFINSVFRNNTASNNGGGLGVDNSSAVVINCSFGNNSASVGGGIDLTAGEAQVGTVTLHNTVLWNNSATSGGQIAVRGDGCTFNADYSDVQGGLGDIYIVDSPAVNWDSASCISEDPVWVNPGGGDYSLSFGSPCIDAGDNAAVPVGVLTDLGGNSRFADDPYTLDSGSGSPPIVDMGAYEYQPAMYGDIVYVDQSAASGSRNGADWDNAFLNLQDALLVAAGGPTQVWVAQGTYKPDSAVPNSRSATFQLINGVALYGGFPSGGGDWGSRDPETHVTVLDGNINDTGTVTDNSYYVVTGSGTDTSAILNGFTIQNGYNVDISGSGAGVRNINGSPTVSRCIFSRNQATNGGGMYNLNSDPVITYCEFSQNSTGPANNAGGGMYNNNSSPVILRCEFLDNWAYWGGGAIYNHAGSHAVIQNCIFSQNSSTSTGYGGGAIHNSSISTTEGHSYPVITNCTFYQNTSSGSGGGMFNRRGSAPVLTNCIFRDNMDAGGQDYSAQIYDTQGSVTVPNYCCITGWTAGMSGLGNIDQDPLFYNPPANDFHLKSYGWRWDPSIPDWDYDLTTSRCIDAGCPGYPITGEEPLVAQIPGYGENIRINMGAYGGTEEASLPPYDWTVLSDVNNDGISNLVDFAELSLEWMTSGDNLPCDFSRDGSIDLADLALLAEDELKEASWH